MFQRRVSTDIGCSAASGVSALNLLNCKQEMSTSLILLEYSPQTVRGGICMHLKEYAVLCISQGRRVGQLVDYSIKMFCCSGPHSNGTHFFASFFLALGFMTMPIWRSFRGLAITANS